MIHQTVTTRRTRRRSLPNRLLLSDKREKEPPPMPVMLPRIRALRNRPRRMRNKRLQSIKRTPRMSHLKILLMMIVAKMKKQRNHRLLARNSSNQLPRPKASNRRRLSQVTTRTLMTATKMSRSYPRARMFNKRNQLPLLNRQRRKRVVTVMTPLMKMLRRSLLPRRLPLVRTPSLPQESRARLRRQLPLRKSPLTTPVRMRSPRNRLQESSQTSQPRLRKELLRRRMMMKRWRMRKTRKKAEKKKPRESSLFRTFHGTLTRTPSANTSVSMARSLMLRSHKDPMASPRASPLSNSAIPKMPRRH
jgi:hypothetical protein